jgi:hypothetical protein
MPSGGTYGTAQSGVIWLAETEFPQVLGASRRAIACQAANKNHPENPSPPGRLCRPDRTNRHDIRSRRADEAPSWAAGFWRRVTATAGQLSPLTSLITEACAAPAYENPIGVAFGQA